MGYINPDEELKRWETCDTQVILANANYYYTKGQVDKLLEDLKNEIINQING
jgi:hypothetical protein